MIRTIRLLLALSLAIGVLPLATGGAAAYQYAGDYCSEQFDAGNVRPFDMWGNRTSSRAATAMACLLQPKPFPTSPLNQYTIRPAVYDWAANGLQAQMTWRVDQYYGGAWHTTLSGLLCRNTFGAMTSQVCVDVTVTRHRNSAGYYDAKAFRFVMAVCDFNATTKALSQCTSSNGSRTFEWLYLNP